MIFLTSIPLWVFPIFLGLLAIALRARSDRRSPVVILYALPLLGLLSFGNTLGFGPIPIGAFVFFWIIGAGLGLRLQPRWTVVREGRFVHLRGEAMTGATILGLFALNFALAWRQGSTLLLAAISRWDWVMHLWSGWARAHWEGAPFRLPVVHRPV